MTKNELKEVFGGVINQLEEYEKRELLEVLFENMTRGQRKQILEHCQVRYATQTRISLEENGIVEEEE